MTSPMEFSQHGDAVFAEFARRFDEADRKRLAVSRRIEPRQFMLLRAALGEYLAGCLGCSPTASESELMERLLDQRHELPNYSPGAQLAPKREQSLAFNLLHRRVASVFSGLELDGVVDGIDLPVNVRVVYGEVNNTDDQPYASTKLHSDVWAGVPADGVVVVIPLMGDIDNLTIEMGEMPRELELEWMKSLESYDAGREVPMTIRYDDVQLRHGNIYFADARLMHQTVRRRREGVRVSIDFRFRMANQAYRDMIPVHELIGPDSADFRVPYDRWLRVGSEIMLAFDETMEHARSHRQLVQTSVYEQRPRSVELFEATR